jgi:hypothetical protein
MIHQDILYFVPDTRNDQHEIDYHRRTIVVNLDRGIGQVLQKLLT